MDLEPLHTRLTQAIGGHDWWRADGPLEVIAGAMLTQQTTWGSVEVAIRNLKERKLMNLEGLAGAPLEVLEECVRPTGFYRVKATRLQTMARHILYRHGSLSEFLSTEGTRLRQSLLSMSGVGLETADSILLYAVGLPFLVVDTYTRRIMERLGMALPRDYEEARRRLEEAVPRGVESYREFHALMVELGKQYCRPRPRCAPCPLLDLCPHGMKVVRGDG
ncbi:MAG: hypothetical protein V3U52_08425 [Thermoplasmata archaeon]